LNTICQSVIADQHTRCNRVIDDCKLPRL
jgi:hypothetical protein